TLRSHFRLRLGSVFYPKRRSSAKLHRLLTDGLATSQPAADFAKCRNRRNKKASKQRSNFGQISIGPFCLILATKNRVPLMTIAVVNPGNPANFYLFGHRRLRRQSPVGFPSPNHSGFGFSSMSLLQVLLKNTAVRQAKNGQFPVNFWSIL